MNDPLIMINPTNFPTQLATDAEKASQAVNGLILTPEFGDNPQGFTDWNDYFSNEVTV